MARDLIPPPSPAGRPGSSAEAERERARELEEQRRKQQKSGLWHRSTEPDRITETVDEIKAAEAPPEERTESPYRSRFGLLLGALIGIGIATLAIGAAVYVGTGSGNGAPEGWSSWKPDTNDGVAAANEIATHVGRNTGSPTATRSSASRGASSPSSTSRSRSRCGPLRRAATSTSSTAARA